MVLTNKEKLEIISILNFTGTDEQLLEIVNEMIAVYYEQVSDYHTIDEFLADFETGNINIITITKNISMLINDEVVETTEELDLLDNQVINDFDIIDNTSTKINELSENPEIIEVLDEISVPKNTKFPRKILLINKNKKALQLNTGRSYYIAFLLVPILLILPTYFGLIRLTNIMITTLLIFILVNLLAILKRHFFMVLKSSVFLIIVDKLLLILLTYISSQNINTILLGSIHLESLILAIIISFFYLFNIYIILNLISNLNSWRLKKAIKNRFELGDIDQKQLILNKLDNINMPWWI